MTVLYGMFGDITVEQKHFNFKMPEFSQLDDATLAAVLNFVVFDLGARGTGASKPLSADDIAAERDARHGRGGGARAPRRRARRPSGRLTLRGWLSERCCWPRSPLGSARARAPRRTTCSTAWAATARRRRACPARFRRWRTRSGASCARPAGRDYVLRVPGAANSVLSDAQLTAVLNWVAEAFNAAELAADGGRSRPQRSRIRAIRRLPTYWPRGARWCGRWRRRAPHRDWTTSGPGF